MRFDNSQVSIGDSVKHTVNGFTYTSTIVNIKYSFEPGEFCSWTDVSGCSIQSVLNNCVCFETHDGYLVSRCDMQAIIHKSGASHANK